MMTQANNYFYDGADVALLNGQYTDVFSLLGMHSTEDGKGLIVRCFLRNALSVDVVSIKDGRRVASLEKVNDAGLFAGTLGRRVNPFPYLLRVEYPLCHEDIIDPYQFGSLLHADDLYLFGEGSSECAYRFLGANWREVQGVEGVHFCVWAPNAKRVSVVGDVNYWDDTRHVMRQHLANGLWEIFLPNVAEGSHYKFALVYQNGERHVKSDPMAKQMECAPHNASIVPKKNGHQWQDNRWMTARESTPWHTRPMSIYEVHLGSWRRKGEQGEQYLNYRDLIDQLIPYVKEQGFTHIELMPISEFPFDGSWGYQPVGLYAPSYRFGDAQGLKAFIDACHRANIGVLLDWVAAHFPKDPHGLVRFDGTCLYEHEDPRKGTHPDWDTLIYNYDRGEVRSFLLSNACYWLREFHIDGLRLDAVSSMLYLDYSREPGQWLPNAYGGRENLEAIHFLQMLNQRLYQSFPGICMIAEESTAFAGVTKPTDSGGLGFGFKWNMGWMNDTLNYLGRDPIYRQYHHHQLTFSLMYAYSEQFMLSISHDEVVHGKGSLLHKIPGDDWQKFATLRAYYGFMWGHPGKKLLFMGSEFAQRDEWNHNHSLDWHLLAYEPHQGVQRWLKDLNHLYQSLGALSVKDYDTQGFRWLDCDNANDSIFTFVRYGDEQDAPLVFVVNMTPSVHSGFRVGLPTLGNYCEYLNSDSQHYGGSNQGNASVVVSEALSWQGMDSSALITVPPLGCLILGPEWGLPSVRMSSL
ncbi:1,4-alpha-glucan branching protein GlgB [Shewanella sp. A25]|nr:1,4-alpha-glucan branching protein GlgB [Shewanella shenzhenensis]